MTALHPVASHRDHRRVARVVAPLAALIVALGIAAAPGCGDDAASPGDGGPVVDAAPSADAGAGADASIGPGPAALDPAVLHEVEITIGAGDLPGFDVDQTMRVHCDLRYDGVLVADAGCRKKGGIGSVDSVLGKPAFSIKLDEYVPDQELDGLDRIVFNNAIQDPSLLHEHLAYEVYRNAGIPAHHTAYAVVSLNGEPKGVYVALEPVDHEFLRAAYGAANDEGNLYESNVADFAIDAAEMELDHEDEGRSRADLEAAAAAVVDASDDDFAALVGAHIDLEQFARFFAVEIATAGEDSYSFGRNNYYMYHRPDADRFVFLPHGQDTCLENPALEPTYPPSGRLAARVRAIPALSAAVDADLAALLADGAAFDVAALEDRIAQAVAVVSATDRSDPVTLGDVAQMTTRAPIIAAQLAYRRAWIEGRAEKPHCGDGVLHRGEQCDDGNPDPGDGCDAECKPECLDGAAAGASWRLCPAQRDWDSALATCAAEGGALAVPGDADEAAALSALWRSHFASSDAWIAVTDAAEENTWRTADGDAPPYLGFVEPEPNGGADENCAILDTSFAGGWGDRACAIELGAICRLP